MGFHIYIFITDVYFCILGLKISLSVTFGHTITQWKGTIIHKLNVTLWEDQILTRNYM